MKELFENLDCSLTTKETYMDFEKVVFPKPKRFFLNIKESPYKIGECRTIPKGTEVWSIDMQTMVSFNEDQIVEVTANTWNGNYFFGKLKQVIGLTYVPGLIDKGKGEISTNFSNTTNFALPKPMIFTYKYKEK